MKKVFTILLALVLVFAIVACAGDDGPAPDAPDAGADAAAEQEEDTDEGEEVATADVSDLAGTTLTFMASQGWIEDAEMELAERFTEETGIYVDFQIIPSDQYFSLLLTRLNTGEATDIFGSQAGRFDIVTQLNVEENALDLSDQEWVQRMDPLAAVEVSVDGRVFGMPVNDNSNVWALAYNRAIFDDLGLEVPTTFDEFMAVCEAILAAGITPIFECVADGWHHVLWFPELGPIIEYNEPGTADRLNNNETTFEDSATAHLILNQIYEMVERGFWGEFYMDNTFDMAARSIAEGRYAMVLANQGFPAAIVEEFPDFDPNDIGFFVMPLADNHILNVNPVGPTRFINANSPNTEAALLYFEFIARPENLQFLIDNAANYNWLPISGATASYTEAVREFFDAHPVRGTVYQTQVMYLNPQWMEMGRELVEFLMGNQDASGVLRNIDANRARQAAAANDPAWD